MEQFKFLAPVDRWPQKGQAQAGAPMTEHVWTYHEKHGEGSPCKCKVPWRHYRCDDSMETPNGLKIASVTQILGVLSKDSLTGWAAKVTAEGCHALARYGTPYRRCKTCKRVGLTETCEKVDKKTKEVCGGDTWRYRIPRLPWMLVKDLRDVGLDHNSVKDEAAFRGTSIHALHEDWVREGKVPNPAEHPVAWHGFIRAYVSWLTFMLDRGYQFTATERIVGSVTHGFAGRCDEIAVLEGPDGRERLDFKTSKQVYARTHFRQLAAYELADMELGNPPTDRQGIVVLRDDGGFEIAWSTATPQDFLNVLAVWRDDQPLKKIEDEAFKARKAREKARG